MTYTVSVLEVNKETYEDIKTRILALGPDYVSMFMDNNHIDLTHVAITPESNRK